MQGPDLAIVASLLRQNALEQLSAGLLLTDPDGYILYINEKTSHISGFQSSELIRQPLHFLYGGQDENIRVSYELDQARKNGQFRSTGWKKHKMVGQRWCELLISPILESGKLAGFSCLLFDRSDDMKMQSDLRAKEQRYRLMVEGVKDYSIFMLDHKGFIVTWNEGARRTIGYSTNEIIGKHFSIFYTLEDLNDGKPQRELQIATETGRYEEEGWRIRKNGSIFWSSVIITALFDEKHQLIGFSKVTRDLTERKEKEEQLKQSEERYRSLVEQVTDYGIFMMDERGKIISWNEGAKKIQGYTAEEIIGKRFTVFYPEEDLINGKPEHELKVATATGKYEEEGWRIRKDGSRFWASVVITAVNNEQKVLVGFSKVTRDLTQRKEAERALRESYDNYRRLSEQLREANSELSYTNRELEQFTSIVSHDLQEPIRTIKSFLMLIENKFGSELGKDGLSYVAKSVSAAGRMQELIRSLLHYSQLSKHEPMRSPVPVENMVNEALSNLKSAIEAKDAAVTTDLQVIKVIGDKVQLVQLIQNLLSNSLKFISDRKPKIHIRCYESDNVATFSIQDNGIGIATEDLHKVFDIFRRLHTDKEYPGTGIGLAICKKIIDRHNGQIWVESTKGQGTTFYFTLEIAK